MSTKTPNWTKDDWGDVGDDAYLSTPNRDSLVKIQYRGTKYVVAGHTAYHITTGLPKRETVFKLRYVLYPSYQHFREVEYRRRLISTAYSYVEAASTQLLERLIHEAGGKIPTRDI